MILFEGPSVLDGQPIVAILTGLDRASKNGKTGEMLQVWILAQNQSPYHAIKSGLDSSVCGNCPHRHFVGGACYVDTAKAPLAVWTAYQNGNYPDLDIDELEGKAIRWGAYGDPAAIPFDAIVPVLEVSDIDGSTGYTHQINHKNFDPRVTMFCQVSADTPKQAIKAHASGYKTFRVAGDASARLPNEIECLADARGLTCAECKLCNGQLANVVITIHGSRAASAKTHDVIARG
jgi:hypothetical protein